MPVEKKRSGRKVNAWIPDDLYSKVDDLKYRTWTDAIVNGLELLVQKNTVDDSEIQKSTDKSTVDDSNTLNTELVKMQKRTEEQNTRIEEYKTQVQSLNSEITRLKTVIMEAPDPLELAITRKENEGLNLLLAEREKRIIELTQYKEDIGAFANYFKSKTPEMIEAPTTEKRRPWYKFW